MIDEFVRSEYGRVVEAVALSTGSPGDAEDAVQVALLRILAEGRPPDRLGLPVTVLACNLIARRKRMPDIVLDRPRGVPLPRRRDLRALRISPLKRALSGLPRRQRLVSILHYYLDYPIADIAPALGTSRVAVAVRLHLARLRLKLMLGEMASP